MGDLLNRRSDTNDDNDIDIDNDTNGPTNNNTKETLDIIANMLTVNPDPLQLWNHRREILLTQTDTDTDASFLPQEKTVTQTALQRNPKSYGAWFHRKWAIRYHLLHHSNNNTNDADAKTSKLENQNLLEGELGLCAEFLSLDERNFHCWHYRRFVVAALAHVLGENVNAIDDGDDDGEHNAEELDSSWAWCDVLQETLGEEFPKIGSQIVSTSTNPNTASSRKLADKERQTLLEREWDFTTQKIEDNFSNGSAFHYRSKLLPLIHADAGSSLGLGRGDRVRQELEFTQNAFFAEPDDQTAWWYHRFLLSWANPFDKRNSTNRNVDEALVGEYKSILMEEYNSILELVEEEEGKCKWGLLGLLQICQAFCKLELSGAEEEDDEFHNKDYWVTLTNDYLAKLQEIDPDRSNRYKSMVIVK
jgi:hypothetical protein